VSEGGDHEGSMGSKPWFSSFSTGKRVGRGESNGVGGIAGVDDEERGKSVAIDDPILDGIELVLGQMNNLLF